MALRTDPFPTSEELTGFRQAARAFTVNGRHIARRAVNPPSPSAEHIAAQIQLFIEATAAWSRLAAWKQIRWTVCAITTWGDPVTLNGALGYGGMTLYMKCWLEQKPAADHQPISPCSARVTDPLASPWNFQP